MKVGFHLVGHVIGIRFWDHCAGDGTTDLIECEAIGRVINVTHHKIILEHWSVHGEDDETTEDNSERVAIVQSCIMSLIEYAPKRGKKFY